MKSPFVRVLASLIAAAGGIALAPRAGADDAPRPARHMDSILLVGGQDAGHQTEETVREHGQIRDSVEQDMILNRLGSRLELRSLDVEVQDERGRLTGGHYESTTSKSTVTTDLAVKEHTLVLTTTSAGKSYSRELPYTGELLGSAGERALLAHARKDQALRFQTFVPDIAAVAEVSMLPKGHERMEADGASIDTLKLEYRVAGIPIVTTMWVDAQGYMVRAVQDTPLGNFEMRRGKPAVAPGGGAELPADSYQGSLALSNIRLPHPRELQQVTLEISAKDAAGIEWPDFTASTQRVLKKTPHALVLEVSQSVPGAYRDGTGPLEAYLTPSPLLQSDDEEVRRIAASAAGEERDPWKVALALQRWVNGHMHFDAGIAVAPAAEVVRDRHGTCVGYAVLLASLVRAQHIPSRLVMGYVYEGRVWGGHAWTEVLIDGQWRALDAAEYAPGIADAARFAVIRDSGQTGTVTDIGKLVPLFTKINVRTLSYRFEDRTVEVAPSAPDHTLAGNTYTNPWLGLTVVKPEDAAFTGMDGHWPELPAVLTVKQADAQVTVLYMDAPTSAPQALDEVLGAAHGPWTQTTWQGLPGVRVRAGDQEALAASEGGTVWVLLARGRGGHALMESLLPGISLTHHG